MLKIQTYTLEEHIHRYAVWTAARAASKSRLKNSEVGYLIDASDLRASINKLKTNSELTETTYRNWLKNKGEEIISLVADKNWSEFKTKQFKFGLAAKLISVYIKTSEVLPTKGLSALAQVAHPPLDSILLKNISKTYGVKLKTNWSTFNWHDYEEVIDHVFALYPHPPYWMIEAEWNSHKSEDI